MKVQLNGGILGLRGENHKTSPGEGEVLKTELIAANLNFCINL